MKQIVYIVRNEGLTPTSSYNEIIMVTESNKDARICLETCKEVRLKLMENEQK